MEEEKVRVNPSLEETADQTSQELVSPAVANEAEAGDQVKEGEHNSRMSAAKAFYRALYAGEESTTGKKDMGAGISVNPEARNQDLDICSNCQATEELMLRADARANEAEALYKRMAADFDNYRKRTDRERDEQYSYGTQKAVEALLPAIDDLDRALTSFTESTDTRSVLESLRLVYNRFAKCLEQLGIKPMESVGQPFDPRLHEPVQQIETSEVPEGQVIHDLRRGYTMGEKVIRPSLVNVATGGITEVLPDNNTEPKKEDLDKPAQSDYSPKSKTPSGAGRSIYDEDEQETQELPIILSKNRSTQEKIKPFDQANTADDSSDSEGVDKNSALDAGT